MDKVINKKAHFSLRERIAIKLVIVIMVVLKPSEWSHEYTRELQEIKELVDGN